MRGNGDGGWLSSSRGWGRGEGRRGGGEDEGSWAGKEGGSDGGRGWNEMEKERGLISCHALGTAPEPPRK